MEDEMINSGNASNNEGDSVLGSDDSVETPPPERLVQSGEITPEELKRMKRINLISFAGVICVIFGAFFGFSTLLYVIRILFPKDASEISATIRIGRVVLSLPEFIFLAGNILLIIGGLGLAKCKNRGRIIVLWALWLLTIVAMIHITWAISNSSYNLVEEIIENGLFLAFLLFITGWLHIRSIKGVCTSEVNVKTTRTALNDYALQNPKIYAKTVNMIAIILAIIWFGLSSMAAIYLFGYLYKVTESHPMFGLRMYMVISTTVLIVCGLCGLISCILLAFLKDIGRKLLTIATWLYMLIYSGALIVVFVKIIIPRYSPLGAFDAVSAGIIAIALILFLFILLLLWLRTDKVKRACGKGSTHTGKHNLIEQNS